MDGLCALIQADAWVWTLGCQVRPNEPQLYPSQRIVLNLLLDVLSRKQIASQMGIPDNTVSGYTKDVYRHFGVNSHVELMRKFLHAE